MIVRVTRATVAKDREAEAFAMLRKLADGIGRPTGMDAMHIARRTEGRAVQLIAVTVWQDMGSLQAATGPGWQAASFAPELDALLTDASVEHYETVVDVFEDLESVGLGSGSAKATA
jgi:hypothetical protein